MDLFSIMTGPVSRMSHVNRYSSYPVLRRENVAEHSWWVGFIGYLIALDVTNGSQDVDRTLVREVLERSIVHDLNECMSGDIIRSYKHTNEDVKAAMNEADHMNMEELTAKMGALAGRTVLTYWEFSKDESLAGNIVAFSDMAAVVFYVREEYHCGNRLLLPVLKTLYETWFHKFHEHPVLAKYIDKMFPLRQYTDALQIPDDPLKLFIRPMTRMGHD